MTNSGKETRERLFPEPPASPESGLATEASPKAESSVKRTVSASGKSGIPAATPLKRIQTSWIWQQLREKRREVSAVIVLTLMAVFWFDVGGIGQRNATSAPDPLDGFDEIFSDLDSADSAQPLRDSADPLDTAENSTFQADSFSIPRVEENNAPLFGSERSDQAPNSTTHFSSQPPKLNASTESNSASPGQRRVKFAGRIQPAN